MHVLAFFLLLTGPAHAYLDPGTGSILVQAILGAVSLGVAFFRERLARLLSFTNWRRGKSDEVARTKNGG